MKWGREDFFPTDLDLADILGDTDFDFENCYFWDLFGSQISRFPGHRFPNFQISGLGPAWARLGPSLGPAWARLGPSWGPAWAQLGPGSWGPTWAQHAPRVRRPSDGKSPFQLARPRRFQARKQKKKAERAERAAKGIQDYGRTHFT